MGLLQTYKQAPLFVSDHECEADVQRQDLSCMYLAHHELKSVFVESSKQASKQAASKQASKQQAAKRASTPPINLRVMFLELNRGYAENAEFEQR